MIEWSKAIAVFCIGFGGVIASLVILQAGILIFSKIVGFFETDATGNNET